MAALRLAPGLVRRLARDPQLLRPLGDGAERIAARARALAGAEAIETGQYRDSIEATAGIDGDRPIGRVNAGVHGPHHAFWALWVEFGRLGQDGKHILRRAAEQAAGRVEQGDR